MSALASRRGRRRPPHPGDAGFSLIEMLLALVVLGLLMGTTVSLLRSQSRAFQRGGTRMELNQNLRFALTTLDRVARTTGAGTTPDQPMLVYAAADAIVFNANYASDLDDGTAVHVNPDLPAGAINALGAATPILLPGTSITYPDSSYTLPGGTPSRAETISFHFRPDSSTPDPNDFVLLQRVNALPSELVARNLQPYPGRPFFEFWYDSATAAGTITTRRLASSRLPVRHSAARHGSPADAGASALADSIRMFRVNLTVTNGMTGAEGTSRRVSTMVRLPNNGLVQLKTCGDAPMLSGTLTVTPNLPGDPPNVRLQWLASVDEAAGERDVTQYNVYFRDAASPDWVPFTTVPAGAPAYDVNHGDGLVAGGSYFFAVAAQDCTPRESGTIVTAAPVLIP
ncbi:MAG TPA: prepilin-type N-terminal cleavage/methylation domain-containing protein [Gemmatimonadales bacterium]|nr:prepilin-type N-terminal cleavage/methylation domain-containing protein [Gemmatimonadales bacterium]